MKLLIKGGKVVNPESNKILGSEDKESPASLDVLVVNGKIAEIAPDMSVDGARIIDVAGKYVFPGLVDMHTHLREPGFEVKETIASGTRAAVRGGFTSVACMPNTKPVADNQAVINLIKEKARQAGMANVYPVGAITKSSRGNELAEMAELRDAGAVAFSDDGNPVVSAKVMRRAMQYAGMLGLPVISHCEDKELAGDGVMNEGYMSGVLGLKGIPGAAEEVMVARDIILSEATGCRLHIAHVSTAGSVRLIREAKARGVPVTAEVTPHHFTLTDKAVAGYDTNTKVNPPLRTSLDVEALKEGLADGTIDVIATDHAPHAADEKDVEFDLAPFGIAGLETAFGLAYKELVESGVLSLSGVVRKMSANPARILGIPKGTLQKGGDADIVIVDPSREEVVDSRLLVGKGKNTPFSGWRLKCLPVITIVGGRIVMQDGRILE